MMTRTLKFVFAALAFTSLSCLAQAPAGSTGQCNDGTYTTAAKKSGACSGHKGVQKWFTAKDTGTATSSSAKASSNSAADSKTATNHPAMAKSQQAAPGGGPGLVWVNTSTKVYHCSGSEFYGKTKEGKYLSESDAKKMGAHPEHGKPCSK